MDIVDTQVHLNLVGIDEGLTAMKALGISAALIDEYDGGDEAGNLKPYLELGDGLVRPICPTAESAALKHPGTLGYLLRVDYRDPELDAVVRLTKASPHARALRACSRLPYEVEAFRADMYRRVFAAADAYDFPLFLRVVEPEKLADYAREFTGARLVLDHCGTPKTPAAFDRVLALAEFPNVSLKWAHAPQFFAAENSHYPFPEMDAYLRRAVDAFGAERIMWASDFTQIGSYHEPKYCYAEALFYIRHNPLLTQAEKEWVLGRTARTVLNWPASTI